MEKNIQGIFVHLFGVILIIAGVIHWFSIFGILPSEKTPFFIGSYFDSLALFDIIAGIGILFRRQWGLWLVFFILITQIPAHSYMAYLDIVHQYGSGFTPIFRFIDIVIIAGGFLLVRTASHVDTQTNL